MGESNRRPNNVLIRADRGSDTDSTDSFNGGSSRRTTSATSAASEAQRGQQEHYRGITFEEILPPQFISNAPPPMVETKRGSVRHSKPDGPPAASLTSEPPAKRSSSSAKRSDSKAGGKSRIRSTARALVRGLSMAKKRDPRGYEAV